MADGSWAQVTRQQSCQSGKGVWGLEAAWTGDDVDPEGNSLGSPGKLQQPHSYNRFLQLKELC